MVTILSLRHVTGCLLWKPAHGCSRARVEACADINTQLTKEKLFITLLLDEVLRGLSLTKKPWGDYQWVSLLQKKTLVWKYGRKGAKIYSVLRVPERRSVCADAKRL